MEKPVANAITNTPEADIDTLLTQFAGQLAQKMGVSNTETNVKGIANKLRWYRNTAGAIVIVKRGADRTVLATISPKKGDWTHLYPSWEKALAELDARKAAANVSRMSHEGLLTGEIPVESDK